MTTKCGMQLSKRRVEKLPVMTATTLSSPKPAGMNLGGLSWFVTKVLGRGPYLAAGGSRKSSFYTRRSKKKKYLETLARSACPHIYKLLTRVITNRIKKLLDEQQLRERAEFRTIFSTTDNTEALNQLSKLSGSTSYPCTSFSSTTRKHLTLNAVVQTNVEEEIEENFAK